MSITDKYNVQVESGTRNHKGFFVEDTDYKLVGIDQSGWALICMNDAVCHYVDPDNLTILADGSVEIAE
ncbi:MULTISPECIES: hypothetical protein [Trichocoleus]|uniref:Phage protein n=1 Tax=Trichocoleus desertorum GB2-A4 TaxID=2933944 RepID=A0ABV0JAD2_9CYAN|nr:MULTISPECIES: hypothetical protein [unclassified Trichocoleus]MBD1861456.1 hypothetical protein [Trichocoleus sp. FACHB-46]MBD2096917.1 hypothetical protein [Trichocoleus sp. FACHB-591]MBD2122120.1 hypothetical protein [Trichocoleus sp. FACHB-262]